MNTTDEQAGHAEAEARAQREAAAAELAELHTRTAELQRRRDAAQRTLSEAQAVESQAQQRRRRELHQAQANGLGAAIQQAYADAAEAHNELGQALLESPIGHALVKLEQARARAYVLERRQDAARGHLGQAPLHGVNVPRRPTDVAEVFTSAAHSAGTVYRQQLDALWREAEGAWVAGKSDTLPAAPPEPPESPEPPT